MSKEITMVRVYLTENKAHLDTLLKRLQDWEKVSGVTVFRAISGFGESGKIHTASLMDMSLDLPVVVEFFDEPDKVEEIISHLSKEISANHIVQWNAIVR